jgi:hypothetical protein
VEAVIRLDIAADVAVALQIDARGIAADSRERHSQYTLDGDTVDCSQNPSALKLALRVPHSPTRHGCW